MSNFKSDKIKVDSDILQRLKVRAASEGETMKKIVESLIISYLENENLQEYTQSSKNKQHHAEMAQ